MAFLQKCIFKSLKSKREVLVTMSYAICDVFYTPKECGLRAIFIKLNKGAYIGHIQGFYSFFKIQSFVLDIIKLELDTPILSKSALMSFVKFCWKLFLSVFFRKKTKRIRPYLARGVDKNYSSNIICEKQSWSLF